jgi:hypothetical protein
LSPAGCAPPEGRNPRGHYRPDEGEQIDAALALAGRKCLDTRKPRIDILGEIRGQTPDDVPHKIGTPELGEHTR